MVGRSTQRALNLKKNWVSTDTSPGLAASVIANNKENAMKSMVINNSSKENVPEDKNIQTSVASTILQKGVDQPKAMASPLAKFEARTVPSISASIMANRGIYNKDNSGSDKTVDPRLKSQSDRLSSLQSLLKVLCCIKLLLFD